MFCIFDDDVKFKEFYDLKTDPEQLNNIVHSLSDERKEWYETKVKHLQKCYGKECQEIEIS